MQADTYQHRPDPAPPEAMKYQRGRGHAHAGADFTVRNLSVLAYAQGFTLWHYKGNFLKMSELMTPGFFRHACDMFADGDMVMISANDGGNVAFVASTANSDVMLAAIGGSSVQ